MRGERPQDVGILAPSAASKAFVSSQIGSSGS